MHDRAERTCLHELSQFIHCGFKAAFMAHTQPHPGRAAGIERAAHLFDSEGDRLFAENMFTRPRCRRYLRRVQRVRRGEDDDVDRPIGKHLFEFRSEADSMFFGNRTMRLAMSHSLRDADDARAAQLTENVLAPLSEAYDSRPLHLFLPHMESSQPHRLENLRTGAHSGSSVHIAPHCVMAQAAMAASFSSAGIMSSGSGLRV
jgi:hypothetical protein